MTDNDDFENDIDPEFTAMWNARLLEYPTITLKGDVWNHFDLSGFDVPEDYVAAHDLGEDLAWETLQKASEYLEADAAAPLMIMYDVAAVMTRGQDAGQNTPEANVAVGFMEEIIRAAQKAHQSWASVFESPKERRERWDRECERDYPAEKRA